MKKIIIILIASCFLFSCKNNDVSAQEETPKQDNVEQPVEQAEATFKPVELEVILDKVRVRDQAGLKGKEIKLIKKGEKVTFLGEISDFTDKIKLRGIQYDDPWLKVKTSSGKEGWIYGAAVKFKSNDAGTDLKNMLITKRLEKFFGSKIVSQIEEYQQAFKAAKTEKDFVLLYRSNKKLTDAMNYKFTEFFELVDFESEYPDLFWIDDPIPAMTLSLVAEGTMYQVFTSVKDFVDKARETTGNNDDEFMKIVKVMHDGDIEYYYPTWFLQTWDYGGYSLLGQGKHTAMLNRMEKLKTKTDLFSQEITTIKTELIEDIVEREDYGEKAETILKELDNIINGAYTVLTENDIIILKNRRPMFENPEKYELSLFQKDY